MLLSDHDRPTERAPGAKPGNLNLLVRLYIYNLYNIRRNGRHILVTSEAISWIIPFPHSQLALEAVENIWIYMKISPITIYHHLSPLGHLGPSPGPATPALPTLSIVAGGRERRRRLAREHALRRQRCADPPGCRGHRAHHAAPLSADRAVAPWRAAGHGSHGKPWWVYHEKWTISDKFWVSVCEVGL